MKSQILKFDLHLKQTNEMDQTHLSGHKHSPRSARPKHVGEQQPSCPWCSHREGQTGTGKNKGFFPCTVPRARNPDGRPGCTHVGRACSVSSTKTLRGRRDRLAPGGPEPQRLLTRGDPRPPPPCNLAETSSRPGNGSGWRLLVLLVLFSSLCLE